MANLNKPNRERSMPTVSIQLAPEHIEWLEEQKWTQRKSMAEVVRELVTSAMDRDGDREPSEALAS